MFLSLLVADIPTSTGTGPRAVTSPDGKGVLQIYNSNVYEMKCDASSCTGKLGHKASPVI